MFLLSNCIKTHVQQGCIQSNLTRVHVHVAAFTVQVGFYPNMVCPVQHIS